MEGLAAPSTQPAVPPSSTSSGSCCSQIPFLELSRFMEACAQQPKQPQKAQKLEHFRKKNIDPIRAHADDLFQIYRLLCPDVRAACSRARGGGQSFKPECTPVPGEGKDTPVSLAGHRRWKGLYAYAALCPCYPLAWGISLVTFHACMHGHQRAYPYASSSLQRDSRRGNYSLKETMLAKRMGVACGLAETSPDVDAVVNWRTHAAAPLPGGKRGRGSSKAMLTGNFVAVLHAVRGIDRVSNV